MSRSCAGKSATGLESVCRTLAKTLRLVVDSLLGYAGSFENGCQNRGEVEFAVHAEPDYALASRAGG